LFVFFSCCLLVSFRSIMGYVRNFHPLKSLQIRQADWCLSFVVPSQYGKRYNRTNVFPKIRISTINNRKHVLIIVPHLPNEPYIIHSKINNIIYECFLAWLIGIKNQLSGLSTSRIIFDFERKNLFTIAFKLPLSLCKPLLIENQYNLAVFLINKPRNHP